MYVAKYWYKKFVVSVNHHSMRFVLLFGLSLLLYGNVTAQHSVGISTGLTISNARPEYAMYDSQTARVGLILNGIYNFQYKNGIYLEAGLAYSQMGYEKVYSDGSSYSENSRFDYLSVPLRAGYCIGSKWQMRAGVILEPALFIGGKVTSWTDSTEPQNASLPPMEEFDLRVGADVGLTYLLTEIVLLDLNIGYIAGLVPFTTWDHTSNVQWSSPLKHNAITIALGVRYNLRE